MARIPFPIPALVLVVGVTATLAGCGGGAPEPPATGRAAADTVLLASGDLAPVTRADLTAGVPVSGTLAADWEARITSPFDDVVEQVLVREGESVREGQVLARFRDDLVSANAASAKARLKSAAADHERQRNLLAEGAVSQRDVEAAEAMWRAALAEDAAASKRLADATVRAPGAGVVTTRRVQAGSRVGTGDLLFVVSNTSRLEFEANVPSEYVSRLRPGATVRLTVTGFDDGAIAGRISRVNAQADPATRQVKVYVSVPNPSGRLVGGLFASGSVVTREVRRALALPAAAFRRDDDSTHVWVLADGRLTRRTVRAGLRDEARDLVEALSGVAEGERAGTGPVEGFVEGRPARVTGKER